MNKTMPDLLLRATMGPILLPFLVKLLGGIKNHVNEHDSGPELSLWKTFIDLMLP